MELLQSCEKPPTEMGPEATLLYPYKSSILIYYTTKNWQNG